MALKLKFKGPVPCAECGFTPVFHGIERWALTFEEVLGLFMPLSRALSPAIVLANRLVDALGTPALKFLALTGLATVTQRPDARDTETTQCLWDEAQARGIEMRQFRPFDLRRNIFSASFNGDSRLFISMPRPNRFSPALLWMDHKPNMKRRFARAGFPVPRGATCVTERGALRALRALTPPVITKPHSGSGGRHTTLNMSDEASLRAGFRSARRLSPLVVVEEQMRGPLFRVTLIDRTLVAVLRRDPPTVTGNGHRTIRELVEIENANPLRAGPIFAKISLTDPAVHAELARQGFSWDTVLSPGQAALLHFKVNWGVGGISYDVTGEVHPANRDLFNEIGAYLDDPIVGIDFIIEDIGKPWYDQRRCGVIECNSMPFIGNHHYPFRGPARNVAASVWDLIFPASRLSKNEKSPAGARDHRA